MIFKQFIVLFFLFLIVQSQDVPEDPESLETPIPAETELDSDVIEETVIDPSRTCEDACHLNATCQQVSNANKHCCECNEGFFGNGVNCLRESDAAYVRGKITGTLNNVKLDDVQLIANVHTIPDDSKSQVVIVNRQSEETDQLLINLVTPIFWLFSLNSDTELQSNAFNGLKITGGTFKRTCWAQFFNSDRDVIGSINIVQNFSPEFTDGIGWTVIANSDITGSLPRLTRNDFIVYQDFKQQYDYNKDESSKTNHVVDSSGSIKYKRMVAGYSASESFEIIYKERIEFSSCYEVEQLEEYSNVVISLKEFTSSYESKSLRFLQNHILLPKNESSDSCDNNDCSDLASCYVDKPKNEFYCVCKHGFNGDGRECVDQNECDDALDICAVDAVCINTPGSFECKCRPPYVGNGRHCELEKINEAETDICASCHPNAHCVSDNGSPRCECLRGYHGNGYVCQQDYISEVPVPEPEIPPVFDVKCSDCDVNAQCVQHENKAGSCCVCNEGYVGNGKYCFYANQMVVLTGKVNGYVNGEELNEAEFFSSVLTLPDDSRNHAGIRFVPIKLASSIQSLMSLATPINWLFAGPHKSGIVSSNEDHKTVVNGFTLTGGNFTRLAKLTYLDDSNGPKELVIQQEYGGLEAKDGAFKINVNTKINGEIPIIDMNSKVHFRNFFQSYRLVRRGLVESEGSLTYDVISSDNSEGSFPHYFRYTDSIKFDQCAFDRDYAESWKVSSKNAYVLHIKGDDLIRFTSTNFIYSEESQDDPCELNTCSIYAECIPNDDVTEKYTCTCKAGFEGDGYTCQDINECERDAASCDDNAICYNLLGHYECKCKAPFIGSGKECFFEQACSACSNNAYCDNDGENGARCICNIGYFGNGYQCEPIRTPEDVCSNCSPHAECMVNKYTRKYECKCKDGFLGNGNSCNPLPCNEYSNCGAHSNCEAKPNGKFECVCAHGYHGDGYKCTTQSCDILNNCGENARCILDILTQNHRCVCMQGYIGNGYKCLFDSQPCNIAKNCHHNAECLFDELVGHHKCTCKPGYMGDGVKCTAQNSCSKDDTICDINAICIFEPRVGDHICRCKSGYEGNGLHRRCYPMGEGPLGLGLVYAQGVSLHKISLDRSEQDNVQPFRSRIVYIPHQTAVAVDFDCLEQNVYWSDVSGKLINKVKPDGSKYDVVLQGLQSPEGIAIDWISRNIYITDSKSKTITVANLKGNYRKILVKANLHNPRGIAVDPIDGYIYWTDWNRKAPKIERANMDGTHRKVLVSDNIGIPNGLYYDHRRREVCWGDAKTKHIECIGRDGNGRRNVTSLNTMHPFDLAEVGQNIYWTDWTRKEIPTVSKNGYINEALKLSPGGNGRLYGISVVKQNCPTGTNSCSFNNGDCEYLCIPLTNGQHQCICPDEVSQAECKNKLKRN